MCRQFDSGPRHRTLLLGFLVAQSVKVLSCELAHFEGRRVTKHANHLLTPPTEHSAESQRGRSQLPPLVVTVSAPDYATMLRCGSSILGHSRSSRRTITLSGGVPNLT